MLVHGETAAQQKPARPQPSQFTLRRDEAGGPEAQLARDRARAGDCGAALPSFDTAIRATIEPTLRRDRGLCHEKLGHPFPAMEDYRAYLIARPEAPDAEQVRQRLSALEEQTGTGGPSDQSKAKEPASARASVSIGDSASASASTSASASASGSASGSTDYEHVAAQEKLADEAEASPLRSGTGVVLGPFVHIPRYYLGENASNDFGYGVGATLRYSTGPMLSVISEIGYAGIGTSGAASGQAGPLLLGGVELRIPVTRFAGDHILLRGGFGYERYVVSGTRAVNNNLLGRFGLGFRHVFGPSIGIEVLVDGGPAYVIPEIGEDRFNAVLGGSVAFVVGF